MVGVARFETDVVPGIFALAFNACQALKYAEVPLPQPGLAHHLVRGAIRDRLDRLQCPAEVAAVEAGECLVPQSLTEQDRLREALLIERAVQMALDAPLSVPGGFAVTDDDELRFAHTETNSPFK